MQNVLLQAMVLFVELEYTLATEEAERIGVDHVARVSSGDATDSSTGNELMLTSHFAGMLTKVDTFLCACCFSNRTCTHVCMFDVSVAEHRIVLWIVFE